MLLDSDKEIYINLILDVMENSIIYNFNSNFRIRL